MDNTSSTQNIRSSEPVNTEAIWPFISLDKIMFDFIIRGTWIFRGQLDVNQLKAGLTKLLTLYPHLTGRMEWDAGVRLNNAGFPFTVTYASDISIDEVNAKRKLADRYSTPLNKRRMKSGKAPLISFKITSVKDGTVLGVRASHTLLDGASFYGMVNNWARICLRQSIDPPIIDQTLHPVSEKPSRDDIVNEALNKGFVKLSFRQIFAFIKMLMPQERTCGFHFSEDALKNLKKQISAKAGCDCSTNEALSALIIQMCIRLNGHTNSKIDYKSVNIVDCRQRISSVPSTFVGNGLFWVNTPSFSASSPIGVKARTLHEGLAPMLTSPSPALKELVTMVFYLSAQKKRLLPMDFARTFCSKPTVIYINNFSRLPIYDVDFGTGTPSAVIPHNLPDPLLIWPAHPDKGGVEVYFTGSFAHTINKLQQDDSWLVELRSAGK